MRVTRTVLVAAALGVMLAACREETPVQPSTDVFVAREITRIDTALREMKPRLPAGLTGLHDAHSKSLAAARKAATPELRLYRLRDAYVGAATLDFLLQHPDEMKDLDAFQRLWSDKAEQFAALPQSKGNFESRALAQAAANRAERLYHASLPYGKASSPGDGLYYLAEAEGNRQFGTFLASLPAASRAIAPVHKERVDAALTSLETSALSAFAADPSGKTTIPASALLKEARELYDAGRLEGAALTLLEARLRLPGSAPVVQSSPPAGDHLRPLIAALSREVPQKGPVAALAPLHDSLFLAPHQKTAVADAPVKVTLLRWPYT